MVSTAGVIIESITPIPQKLTPIATEVAAASYEQEPEAGYALSTPRLVDQCIRPKVSPFPLYQTLQNAADPAGASQCTRSCGWRWISKQRLVAHTSDSGVDVLVQDERGNEEEGDEQGGVKLGTWQPRDSA